jgi:hypothetical protein
VAKLWRNLQTSQKFEGSKMNDKKDEFKECIAREFEEIAREEEEFLENDTSLVVPEGTKDAVLARVREQIRAYEMEQTRKETEEAINHLSEEDREALELGRKMLKAGIGKKDPEEPSGKKVRRKKKPLKMYLALAAVIVCVLAMGITSMGGPERIVRMMTQNVGDREVDQVDSNHTDKENKVIEGEEEEKAYQEIGDVFNTDIVKLSANLKGMKFDSMNLDENNQIAENYYTYNKKTIAYIISAPYRENSWGVDFEDPIEKKYTEKLHNCKVDITVYKIDKNEGFGYAAEFKYNNIDYLLTGTMRQQEFDKLLKSLFFPK